MSVPTAASTATLTADELIVETSAGTQYRINGFNKTINLATTGAGGMDTGTAPASGYVALYAIYNPTTAASALLAVNATAAKAPEIYAGANAPTGYTASALVSVFGTNSSSQFKIGCQNDRKISFPLVFVINTTGSGTSNPLTPSSFASAVPKNAKTAFITAGTSNNNNSGGAYSSLSIAADANGTNMGVSAGYTGLNIGSSAAFEITMITAQTLYLSLFASGGTTSYNIICSAYNF